MPYRSNLELPPAVRSHLPNDGQDVYREAYNYAYGAYAGDAERDKRAHTMAWAAVKRVYAKSGDQWVPRRQSASP